MKCFSGRLERVCLFSITDFCKDANLAQCLIYLPFNSLISLTSIGFTIQINNFETLECEVLQRIISTGLSCEAFCTHKVTYQKTICGCYSLFTTVFYCLLICLHLQQERLRQLRSGSTNPKEIYSQDGHTNNSNNYFPLDGYGTRSQYMFDFNPSLNNSLNH